MKASQIIQADYRKRGEDPNAIFDVSGGGINNVQPDWWQTMSFD